MKTFPLVCRSQDGTNNDDDFQAVIGRRRDGAILLAGTTYGSWATSENNSSGADYAAVLIDYSMFNISTISPTPSFTGDPTTAPTPSTIPTPTPAAVVTHVPSSVAPMPANCCESGTHWPDQVSTPLSSTSLSLIIGSVVGGAAVLAVLGVRIKRACRRSRRAINTTNARSFPAACRHFPSAVPAVNGALRSVPSQHFPAAVSPVDGNSLPSHRSIGESRSSHS